MTKAIALGTLLLLSLFCHGQQSNADTLSRSEQEGMSSSASSLNVLSFNIRHNNPQDGDDAWPLRKPLAYRTIRLESPDIMGLQEVLHNQVLDIEAEFPNYSFHGVGRDDGKAGGEYVPILFLTERFELIVSGHFWLSERPTVPGVKSWDSSATRMMSWVLLRDRLAPLQTPLLVLNTHYDSRGERARLESSKLIAQWVDNLDWDAQLIVLGDFNTAPETEPYDILMSRLNLRDAHAGVASMGTYHGFTGVPNTGRIDWILHSPDLIRVNSELLVFNDNGKFPSDHFPVSASFVYAGGEAEP